LVYDMFGTYCVDTTMNERIDEIILEHGLHKAECYSRMKMVAELIVKECANRLRETDYELIFVEDGMCNPSISDAMLVAASDIEDYFGVKE